MCNASACASRSWAWRGVVGEGGGGRGRAALRRCARLGLVRIGKEVRGKVGGQNASVC
jgi:hypothetical protein